MHIWQLQEAKAKLTQLLNEAQIEPQFISRRSVNQVVVISMKKYDELTRNKENLVSFLRNSPLKGLNLEINRDKSLSREVDL